MKRSLSGVLLVLVGMVLGALVLPSQETQGNIFSRFLRPRFKRPTQSPRIGPLPRFAHKPKYRIVLVGDTGKVGTISAAVKAAMKKEKKDFVVALGDLVYLSTPKCPSGRLDAKSKKIMDKKLGNILLDLDAPVFLVLGNHGVHQRRVDARREACLLDYASLHKQLIYPSHTYTVDLGFLRLVVLNTNLLFGSKGAVRYISDLNGFQLRRELHGFKGRTLFVGHHVLKTYHNKQRQDYLMPWFRRHGFKPDVYANGHAHLLQFGVYHGIPAITSGSGAKITRVASCPGNCGQGQLWGRSVAGYAVLEISRLSTEVTFKDLNGLKLWSWKKVKKPKKKPAPTTPKKKPAPATPKKQ